MLDLVNRLTNPHVLPELVHLENLRYVFLTQILDFFLTEVLGVLLKIDKEVDKTPLSHPHSPKRLQLILQLYQGGGNKLMITIETNDYFTHGF